MDVGQSLGRPERPAVSHLGQLYEIQASIPEHLPKILGCSPTFP